MLFYNRSHCLFVTWDSAYGVMTNWVLPGNWVSINYPLIIILNTCERLMYKRMAFH